MGFNAHVYNAVWNIAYYLHMIWLSNHNYLGVSHNCGTVVNYGVPYFQSKPTCDYSELSAAKNIQDYPRLTSQWETCRADAGWLMEN